MKKSIVFLILLAAFLLFSCGTTEEAVVEPAFDMTKLNEALKAAFGSRDKADSIKASVAVKEDYAAAAALFETAENAKGSENFIDSLKAYIDATLMFDDVYKKAEVKKTKADTEMTDLNSVMEEVQRKAQAEVEIEEKSEEM